MINPWIQRILWMSMVSGCSISASSIEIGRAPSHEEGQERISSIPVKIGI